MDRNATASPRMAGIDLARALAMFGMFAVHVSDPWRNPNLLTGLTHGRASVLFVLVAGVGVSLLSRRHPSAGRRRLLLYAALLLPIGLALQVAGHGVSVILQHYAAYFVLGAAATFLGKRALLAAACLWTAFGPVAWFAAAGIDPLVPARDQADLFTDPLRIAWLVLVAGPYPLVTWGPVLLWGAWIGRLDLADPSVRLRMAGGGLAVAVAAAAVSSATGAFWGADPADVPAWHTILADGPHAGTIGWLAVSCGLAAAALAACLWASERWPAATAPLARAGAMALSLYVLHLAVLVLVPMDHADPLRGLAAATLLGTGAVAFAHAWSRRHDRGPLEGWMHRTWEAASGGTPAR